MHAVVFSQKSMRSSSGLRQCADEEGWLDEAMAHLAEDLNGFSMSNIDYRVSAFLTSPERYQLVVDDYYTADLFRSHGNRGSTYLFYVGVWISTVKSCSGAGAFAVEGGGQSRGRDRCDIC